MATNHGETNVVLVAFKKPDGSRVFAGHLYGEVFGYFATEGEIPDGWVANGTEDITDIMDGRLTKLQALEMMNRHWK